MTFSSGTVWAYTYSPPWADNYGGNWGDLDTTAAAANAYSQLAAIGYHAYKDLYTYDVVAAMSTAGAQSDAIWADFGHGAANGSGGWISWCSTNHSPCSTYLYANGNVGSCTGLGQCLKTTYQTTIHKIRLMVFAGCNSGSNGAGSGSDPQQSNLVKTAYSYNGVDSAIGFTVEVGYSASTGEAWASNFFYQLGYPNTVSQSASLAAQAVRNLNGGNAWGWDHYLIMGGSVTIKPPAYGS